MAVTRNDASRLVVLDERDSDEPDIGCAVMWSHKACFQQAIRPGHRHFPWDED